MRPSTPNLGMENAVINDVMLTSIIPYLSLGLCESPVDERAYGHIWAHAGRWVCVRDHIWAQTGICAGMCAQTDGRLSKAHLLRL